MGWNTNQRTGKTGEWINEKMSVVQKRKRVKEFGNRLNIWELSPVTNNTTNHPAPFPEQLAADHIISWSNEGDIVFDPFCGSGTTCKMAVLNNRNYLGIEISQEYCDIACKRIEGHKDKVEDGDEK